MANEQYAFLKKASVPNRQQWQEAIDRSGFDLELDPDLRPFEASGFMPCKFLGSEAGVEIYFDDSDAHLSEFRDIARDRDCCISFRWGGSMSECACAMIASYVLAKEFGAVVSYEGDAPYGDLDQLLSDTMATIEDAKKSS